MDKRPKNWVEVQWILYDMTFYGLNRVKALHKMMKLAGLTRREAAETILDYEREREV